MLLFHPIRKTFEDFDEVYTYYIHGENGKASRIEVDTPLRKGQVLILGGISRYAIVVMDVWEEPDGSKHFQVVSAEGIVVRGREPKM